MRQVWAYRLFIGHSHWWQWVTLRSPSSSTSQGFAPFVTAMELKKTRFMCALCPCAICVYPCFATKHKLIWNGSTISFSFSSVSRFGSSRNGSMLVEKWTSEINETEEQKRYCSFFLCPRIQQNIFILKWFQLWAENVLWHLSADLCRKRHLG